MSQPSDSRIVALLIRGKVPLLVVIGLLTVGAVTSSTTVTFDNSIESWFVEGDPAFRTKDMK